VILQIYEVQEPAEAAVLVQMGVDHIGSVLLSAQGWRQPGIRETVRAVQRGGARSGLIPLFADEPVLRRLLDYYHPDFVHFCEALSPFPGDEEAAARQCDTFLHLQQTLRGAFPGVAVMRSLSVPRPGAACKTSILENLLAQMRLLASESDFFLLDTLRGNGREAASQPVAGFVGITGEVCDWDLAARLVAESPIPVILAGGLGPENAYEAVRRVQPAGVDSCTRTNATDDAGRPVRFRKDLGKVRGMIDEVRRARAEGKADTERGRAS
jgi:phosphoribosylanthranilate isomerase